MARQWISQNIFDDKSTLVQVNGVVPDAIKQQAITLANFDLDLCQQVVSLGHSELSSAWDIETCGPFY